MDTRGIDFGLRFLGEEASFDISFSLIEYSGASSYARAYLVGLLNTILVAVIGIFFATILGVDYWYCQIIFKLFNCKSFRMVH